MVRAAWPQTESPRSWHFLTAASFSFFFFSLLLPLLLLELLLLLGKGVPLLLVRVGVEKLQHIEAGGLELALLEVLILLLPLWVLPGCLHLMLGVPLVAHVCYTRLETHRQQLPVLLGLCLGGASQPSLEKIIPVAPMKKK